MQAIILKFFLLVSQMKAKYQQRFLNFYVFVNVFATPKQKYINYKNNKLDTIQLNSFE